MISKNPFLVKNSEQQDKEEEYLALFDSSVLQIFSNQSFKKVSQILSTPGAGKTSLFRALSPRILSLVCKNGDNEDYTELLKQLSNLQIIKDNKVSLISMILSCARGYGIIEEMFENGRRKQMLFALLNLRIIISFARSICELLSFSDMSELANVTFRHIPDELSSELTVASNVYNAYVWACEQEKKLCEYLDNDRNNTPRVSFVHTTLIAIKLFEASNILFNGQEVFENSIIIFDDFHKLTDLQRRSVLESIYTLKSSTGVWLGQRLEGLDNAKIITSDASIGRDYNEPIVIDNYWSQKRETFYRILESIADKRVKDARVGRIRKFFDCISNDIPSHKCKKQLELSISNAVDYARKNTNKDYTTVFQYIEEKSADNLYIKAIYYECLRIFINRFPYEQMSLFNEQETVPVDDYVRCVEKVMDIAEYYLCFIYHLPFYYGREKMLKMSSYNIEQFLYFAADIFEATRIKSLGKSSVSKLTAEEQEKIIRNAVEEKWLDMDYRYSNSDRIKLFIERVAIIAQRSRDAERASYAGGAYTGIGVKSRDLEEFATKNCGDEIIDILGKCLASNYLEKRVDIRNDTTVFYLNRWICVRYNLPLAYGGWKPCSIRNLMNMCKDDWD